MHNLGNKTRERNQQCRQDTIFRCDLVVVRTVLGSLSNISTLYTIVTTIAFSYTEEKSPQHYQLQYFFLSGKRLFAPCKTEFFVSNNLLAKISIRFDVNEIQTPGYCLIQGKGKEQQFAILPS